MTSPARMRALLSTLLAALIVTGAVRAEAREASNGRGTSKRSAAESARGGTSSARGKGGKPATPRSKTKRRPERAAKPCAKVEASVGRSEFAERRTLVLLGCDGAPTREAHLFLSQLARHRSAHRPSGEELDRLGGAKAARHGVALIDVALVGRLAALVRRFPGHEVDVVSGFRPDSDGSQHQKARALDVVLRGVDNRALFEACKDLDDTGCGYYPNSSFVHVDVRPSGLGTSWIDASGPGQSPRYVARWSDGAVAGPRRVASNGARPPSEVANTKAAAPASAGRKLAATPSRLRARRAAKR